MSTVVQTNLEFVSDYFKNQMRHFRLADATLVDPTNPVCLVDGEWMNLNNSALLTRASTIGTVGNLATTPAFVNISQRGRTDIQAQAEKGVVVAFLGEYEADTRIFDAAAVAGGAAITTIHQPLCIATITLGARNYTGLVGATMSSNGPIVGYVTRLPSQNGGKLRFLKSFAVRNGATLS